MRLLVAHCIEYFNLANSLYGITHALCDDVRSSLEKNYIVFSLDRRTLKAGLQGIVNYLCER